MQFKACVYTPKTCECPLPEKHLITEAMECNCCKHLSQYAPDRWSRHHYCKGGESCIMTCFPYRIQYQWEMMQRCATVVGMGALDISIEKFKFFISDILGIEKEYWQEIYDIFLNMVLLSQKYTEKNSHIEATDIEMIRELSKRG